MSRRLHGWRSTDRRHADGAIDSAQRVVATEPLVEPSEEGARRLGAAYWRAATRAGRGLVRRRERDGRVELRLLGVPLLTFDGPEVAAGPDQMTCTYRISGGLLARRPGGSLTLEQHGAELAVAVEGFVPRLALIHRPLQSRLHAAVSRRYFRRLLAETRA